MSLMSSTLRVVCCKMVVVGIGFLIRMRSPEAPQNAIWRNTEGLSCSCIDETGTCWRDSQGAALKEAGKPVLSPQRELFSLASVSADNMDSVY